MRIHAIFAMLLSGHMAAAATAIDVDASAFLGCALFHNGEVYCFGQIPGNEFEQPFSATRVPGLPPATAIATGRFGACAIDDAGRLWCWGLDYQRSARRQDLVLSNQPFQVDGLPKVRSVVLGYAHLCAISDTHDVWCWGSNACGEVGCGHADPVAEPTRVPHPGMARSISAGVNNTCATFAGGGLSCWGSDNPTMPGRPFIYESVDPVLLKEDYFGKMRVVANGRNFACGIRESASGAVTCWGSNIMGQLGSETPRLAEGRVGIGEVDGISHAQDIGAGYFNACAVADGRVVCWGAPLFGSGSEPMSQPPTEVPGLDAATRVALASEFGCAVAQGEVRCWGTADFDGKPLIEGMTPTNPVPVPGMPISAVTGSYDAGLQAADAADYRAALDIWWPLARRGDAAARTGLGRLYLNGWGVPQDDAEAVRLYRLAADQGDARAQFYLGDLSEQGRFVAKDPVEAARLYRLAASQQHAPAQYQLGVMYRDGTGVEQSRKSAHMWFSIAEAHGEPRASGSLTWLQAAMDPQDIEDAQRRAGVCMASGFTDCD